MHAPAGAAAAVVEFLPIGTRLVIEVLVPQLWNAWRTPLLAKANADALAVLQATGREFLEVVAEVHPRGPCEWLLRAAWVGNRDVVAWLGPGRRLHRAHAQLAARGGHIDVLRWLRGRGCPWDEQTCEQAAAGGHLSLLQWARARGCPWNEWTCEAAAAGGHLDVLQWARARGCPWNRCTFFAAARHGDLVVLDFLRREACPWDAWTCAGAAQGGHLHVLKWLRRHGCPWNASTCKHAAYYGHARVLEWAIEQGCPQRDWMDEYAAETWTNPEFVFW